MNKPQINKPVHIPYIQIQDYLDSKYGISKETRFHYDHVILQSHMFRGNDTTKGFYPSFLNEGMDDNLVKKLKPFLDNDMLDSIMSADSIAEVEKYIKSKSVEFWVEQYKILTSKKDDIEKNINNDHDWKYIVDGIYCSIVINMYDLEDVETIGAHYWYFSW